MINTLLHLAGKFASDITRRAFRSVSHSCAWYMYHIVRPLLFKVCSCHGVNWPSPQHIALIIISCARATLWELSPFSSTRTLSGLCVVGGAPMKRQHHTHARAATIGCCCRRRRGGKTDTHTHTGRKAQLLILVLYYMLCVQSLKAHLLTVCVRAGCGNISCRALIEHTEH